MTFVDQIKYINRIKDEVSKSGNYRFESVTWYNNIVNNDSRYLSLPFANIFQSFVDPERPTEEEFVMFKLQYGVDWIVEPVK